MIIFDLDGTLADCEHRRHFVDPRKAKCRTCEIEYADLLSSRLLPCPDCGGNRYQMKWKPDWKAYNEACDKDKPIEPLVEVWNNYEIEIALRKSSLVIWSGRCESLREKTLKWLNDNLYGIGINGFDRILKMRPVGDTTPLEKLKERWLDEWFTSGGKIDFAFDSHLPSIDMWHRRGVFVFNCTQGKKECF